jgi:hypothetical protein
MKRGRVILLSVGVAIVTAVVGIYALRPREPVYRGKPLSFWLEGYRPSQLGGPEQTNADEAILQVGTNAIPTLLRMARAKDSALTLKLVELTQKQRFLRFDYIRASERNIQAVHGFRQLSAAAKDAVSEPFHSLPQETTPAALGYIGPAAEKSIPVLLRCATNANPMVRGNAVYALGQIQREPDLVVPILLKSLNDPDPGVRGDAAFSVGAFGARQAIPTLLELLDDHLEWTREQAAEALKKIDPVAAAKAGVK